MICDTRAFALVAVTIAAALAVPVAAGAQSQSKDTTPFIIHAKPLSDIVLGEERVAARGEPLLTLPATTMRAAVLEQETATLTGFGALKALPAGTQMFGIYTPTGWAYCAKGEGQSWWRGGELVCFEDDDRDGQFETVMGSGNPFLGVPFFVFNTRRRVPLDAPVSYRRIDVLDGPTMTFALYGGLATPRNRPAHYRVDGGFLKEGNETRVNISGWTNLALPLEGAPTPIKISGIEIEMLGATEDGGVRYRVMKLPEPHIGRSTMVVTQSVTPIFIPG